MSPRPRRVRQPRREDDTTLPKVQATVTVAPATVQAASTGDVRRPRKAATRQPKATPVVVLAKPHPAALQAAQALLRSGHGYTRVQVTSPTELVVR